MSAMGSSQNSQENPSLFIAQVHENAVVGNAPKRLGYEGDWRLHSHAMADLPDEEQLSRYFSMLGKKGGKARFARMTAEERKALATKASKAAAKKRTARAKARKKAKS